MDATTRPRTQRATDLTTPDRRRCRVWFGEQVLCELSAPRPQAERYATAMRRRFLGLRVTLEDEPERSPSPPLPDNSALRPLTVK